MVDALLWFLALELLGAIALPWAYLLFRFLPDRGITLVKPAALLFVSYLVWVAGITHILPNTQLTIWAIVLCAAIASIWLAGKLREELQDFLQRNWPVLLVAELVFLLMFVAWALVVSGSPAITHTEKPMDFMLLNAALQTRFFPAEDPWLSGHSISYYYFGHIIMATMAKMSGVVSSVAYNLAVAAIPALAGAVCFGLLYNLVRLAGGKMRWALGFGLAAPALILLAGNLVGALEFVRIRGWAGQSFWDWVGINGLDATGSVGGSFPSDFWWWFRSTRVIGTYGDEGVLDYTITEFPLFSFLLGDLHAHVLAIPFLLLAIATALNAYCSDGRLSLAWLRHYPAQGVCLALCGGALAFINFWDFATFMALLAVALLLKGCRDYRDSLLEAANGAASVFLPLFLLSIAMFLPIYFTFSGQTSGVLPLRDVATRPFHLFLVVGLFAVPSLALLAQRVIGSLRYRPKDTPLAVTALLLAVIPLCLWMATAFLFAIVTDGVEPALNDLVRRLVLVAPGAIVVAVAAYLAGVSARKGNDSASSFVLLLMALAFFLIMIAELFHIVDSFSGPWRRMNTVFKVYYQAWIFLGVTAVFGVFSLFSGRLSPLELSRRRYLAAIAIRGLGGACLALVFVAAFYYTIGSTMERSGAYGVPSEGRTLDGLAYLTSANPGEYEAIEWLREEAPFGRIVEAVGDDYTQYGNISASTGLPTVLGWIGHELQWRGSSEPFAGRVEDVAAIYSGQDPEIARRLLEKYGVRYVYVGNRELERYGVSSLPQYGEFLRTVFQQDGVIVYEHFDSPDL